MKTNAKHKINLNDPDLEMPSLTDQQLKSMRHVTRAEHDQFRKALESTFHRPFPSRMGRPPKPANEKAVSVHIRLRQRVYSWAKSQAKQRHIPYQTFINNVLERMAS